MCSKLAINDARRLSGVFIVNLEHISRLALVFLPCSSVSIVNFEHAIAGWGRPIVSSKIEVNRYPDAAIGNKNITEAGNKI